MKKILILFLLFTLPLSAQSGKKYILPGVKFEMSVHQVTTAMNRLGAKKLQGQPKLSAPEFHSFKFYEVEAAKMQTKFYKNRLYWVAIYLKPNGNDSVQIRQFNSIKVKLTEMFGVPISVRDTTNKVTWWNGIFWEYVIELVLAEDKSISVTFQHLGGGPPGTNNRR